MNWFFWITSGTVFILPEEDEEVLLKELLLLKAKARDDMDLIFLENRFKDLSIIW